VRKRFRRKGGKTLLPERKSGMTYGLSNTGPLISAFQSDSFELLTEIFMAVITSTTCLAELKEHGWEAEIRAAGADLKSKLELTFPVSPESY
jgi:hypothetical protein